MEQRISVAQSNELNDGQKERLREWWEPAGDDVFWVDGEGLVIRHDAYQEFGQLVPQFYVNGRMIPKTKCLPLLSIGQCIELIASKTNEMGLQFYNTTCDWHVWLGNYGGRMKRDWLEDELITTLWQAVKTIL